MPERANAARALARFLLLTVMRVLVVDESAERAALLREALSSAGHEVAGALSSPLELLRAGGTLPPDVIVIDTESPDRQGAERGGVGERSSPPPVRIFPSQPGGEG